MSSSSSGASGGKVDLAVVFAAGQGTRMRSTLPKVLCEIAALSMLEHVTTTASMCARCVLLVLSEELAEEGLARFPRARYPQVLQTVQQRQDGTGGAAACAMAYAAEHALAAESVIFLNGDAPLVSHDSVQRLVSLVGEGGAPLALLGFSSEKPYGYGRLLGVRGKSDFLIEDKSGDGSDDRVDFVEAVREECDCTPAERAVPFCNAGVYASSLGLEALRALLAKLPSVDVGRALPERRLTDMVATGGAKVAVVWTEEEEALGVNSLAELARAERCWQQRKRASLIEQGVRMLAPDTVFFSHDTSVGEGTLIEPYVVFGEKVEIGENAHIGSFCHLEGTRLAARASVGPFARLRVDSLVGEGAKVGNFVETKNATLAANAKASHLSYLGDCSIGEGANIGAGVITCNYDGKKKHRTEIGAHAFIGSNSSLIAPLVVGERACIGASSAIAENVAADTLALERNAVTLKPLSQKVVSEKGG